MGNPNSMVNGMGLILKCEPVIFQNIGPDICKGVTTARYIDYVRDLMLCHFLQIIGTTLYSMTTPVLHLQESQDTFCSKTTQRPAISPDPIEYLWNEIQRPLIEIQQRPVAAAELYASILVFFSRIPIAFRGRRGRMVVGFMTICAISACHH